MQFFIFDRWGTQKGTLDGIISAVHTDELNGEDTLTIKLTSTDLIKGDRIVWRDKFSVWHEHIVNDITDEHANGKMLAIVYAETSLAELYLDYIEDRRPYNVSATLALTSALHGTRWQVGTVNVSGTSSAIFYQESAREALTDILENWGGELSSTITVSGTGVSARAVNITTRRGTDNGKRFTWDKDIEAIERRVYPDDVCTALYGYGKGLEVYDDEGQLTGGFTRKLTFGEINGGLDYVYDDTAKQTWGNLDANGNKVHAFGRVDFPECEDMAELLSLTTAELQKRKVPQVTYTASVLDLADAGYAFEDVRTGDTVQIIDDELGERLEGRVLCVARDLFNESATRVTLGNITRTIGDVISRNEQTLARLQEHSSAWDGAASLSTSYIDAVINNLNTTMNTTGGYVYWEQGEGIIVYDRAKDDNPTMAIQLTGAGFRIANTKNSQGEWNWRTFGTGAGFTADELKVGTIRGGNSYWNLDTGTLVIGGGSSIGSTTVDDLISDVDASIVDVDVEYAHNQSTTTAPTNGWSTTAPAYQEGYYIWQRTKTVTPTQTTYSDPVCISGKDGQDGAQGPAGSSVTVSSIQYVTSTTETQPSSGWSTTPPTTVAKGSWLWVKTTYSDNTTAVTRSYQGENGQNGQNGTSVTVSSTQYQAGASATTAPTGTWSNSPVSVAAGQYLWTKVTYSDGSTSYSVARQGTNGTNGQNGTSVGVTSTVLAYQKSTSGTTVPTGTWSSSPLAPTTTEYVWTRTTTTFSDGNTAVSYSVGGKTGTNGTSVSVSSIQYGTSDGGDTQPSQWVGTVPTPSKGQWLWVKTIYSNGSTATTKSYVGTDGEDGNSVSVQSVTHSGSNTVVVLVDSDGVQSTLNIPDGQDGDNGAPGAAGYVHTAWATSADGTQGFSTSVSTNKTYLGVYTDHTQADSQTPSDYSWSLIKGAKGDTGAKGDKGDTGAQGPQGIQGVAGKDAKWYYGPLLTHTSGTPTLAASSTPDAVVGSMYLNNETGNIYSCTELNNPSGYNKWAYVGNTADGIAIGGTNLLPDSNAPTFTKVYGTQDRYLSDSGASSYASGEFFTVTDPPVDGIKYGYRISCTTASTATSGAIQRGYAWMNTIANPNFRTVAGGTYTLSCYVRKVSGNPIINQRYCYQNNSGNNTYVGSDWQNITSTAWTQVSYTFTYPSDMQGALQIYPIQLKVSSVGVIEACGWQLETGNKASAWSLSLVDLQGATATAQATANGANDQTQIIYWRSASARTSSSALPTSWITQTDNVYDQWTTLKPQLAASTAANETKYPYVYSCTQRKSVSGSVTYSTILLNVDGLVIDGANLIANSVTANAINASSLNASNSLTVGAMTSEAQSSILNFNLADSVQNLLAGTTSPTVSDTQWSPSLLTDNPLTWQRWGAATYSTLTKTTDGVKLQYLNNGSSGGICIPLVAENCITNGETVTVSFTYRGTITTTGSFWLLSKSGANAYNSDALTLTGDEEWHTVYKTFTAVRNANTCVALLIGYTSATGKYLEIKDSTMMLERGDTKKAIDAASQTATNYITADSTGIKIHNAGDSSNYQHLTPSEQAFYIGGTKVRSDTASASSFCEGNVQINTASGSGQTTAEISAFAPEYSTSSTDTKVTLKLGADAGNGLNETFNVIVQRNNTETPIASFRRYNVDYTYLAGSLNDGYWTRYKVNNSHVFVEFWYDSVSFDVITSAGVTASGSIPITLAPLDGDTFTKVGQQFAVKTTSNGIQAGCVWVATDGSVHAQCTAGAARTLITSFSYPIY